MGKSVRFRDVTIDFDRFRLERGGVAIPTQPQVFDVLEYLIDHRDRVVSKEELLDNIWGDRFVSESTLTTRIKGARQATGDDGQRQEVIQTVHGRGYRFVSPLLPFDVPEPAVDHEASLPAGRRRRLALTPERLIERGSLIDRLDGALASTAGGSQIVVARASGDRELADEVATHIVPTIRGQWRTYKSELLFYLCLAGARCDRDVAPSEPFATAIRGDLAAAAASFDAIGRRHEAAVCRAAIGERQWP